MLLIDVEFRVTPEQRDGFLSAARALEAPSGAEEGCRFFEFWSRLDDPGRFLLHERWDDLESLLAHRGTPHVKAFGAAVAALGLEGTTVVRYRAEEADV